MRESGYRDDFFLKLFAAARVGGEALDGVIATQREAYVQELAALADLRAQFQSDPLVRLLVEAATLHTEANLRVVELAEASRTEVASRAVHRQREERAEGMDKAGAERNAG